MCSKSSPRLESTIAKLQRWRFGRRSEKLSPDQISLWEEALATEIAAMESLLETVLRQIYANRLNLHLQTPIAREEKVRNGVTFGTGRKMAGHSDSHGSATGGRKKVERMPLLWWQAA